LELLLNKCNISIIYWILNQQLDAQVIVLAIIVNRTNEFIIPEFSGDAILISSIVLISTILFKILL
jgi:hypothetical protein